MQLAVNNVMPKSPLRLRRTQDTKPPLSRYNTPWQNSLRVNDSFMLVAHEIDLTQIKLHWLKSFKSNKLRHRINSGETEYKRQCAVQLVQKDWLFDM